MKIISKAIMLVSLAFIGQSLKAQENHGNITSVKVEESEGKMPAIRLINNPDGTCSFEKGYIPTLKHASTTTFWSSNKTEDWEKMRILLHDVNM
ncbi:hypothetical protein OKW96_08415 [Sphingobacterium sp. KU25419]|nr:hypothetical protein OKW96_08415 [Sphingobacterium sp. KU25419]